MVESAMNTLPAERLIGVQLSGMGNDGAKAIANLRAKGGANRCPGRGHIGCIRNAGGELVRLRGADAILPAQAIPRQLMSWLAPVTAKRVSVETRYGTR
jgi:two-component system chemotaxis response regulator CheB